QVAQSDVLYHPHAGDFVVAVARLQITIVANLHPAAVAESGGGDTLSRQRCLVLAESDARRIDTVVLRGVHDEATPAAADVQKPLARLEPQLATDQIQLRFLGGVERLVRRAE